MKLATTPTLDQMKDRIEEMYKANVELVPAPGETIKWHVIKDGWPMSGLEVVLKDGWYVFQLEVR